MGTVSSHNVHRVLVVGAGIGGLTAATALAQRGVEVEVVELRPELALAGNGVGLGQSANALRVLRRIGILEDCLDAGMIFDRIKLFDDTGSHIADHVFNMGGIELPAFCSLRRSDLHRFLVEKSQQSGVKITTGDTVQSFEQDDAGVSVQYQKGRQSRFDVLIGFDGIRSRIRNLLFGEAFTPRYTGYGAWRVSAPRDDAVTSMENYSSIGGKVAILPMGQDSMYISHLRSEPGNPFFQPEDLLDSLRQRMEGYAGIPGAVRDALSDQSSIVYSPLEIVSVTDPWFIGRVIIAGDAAHAGLPHLTQGAAMALEDAAILAEELTSPKSVAQSLQAFMSRRFERCKFVQDISFEILRIEQSEPEISPKAAAKAHIAKEFGRLLALADTELDKHVLIEE